MVNLSLNKNEAGVVTLTLEYHESTEMELLFDFIRSQASNAYVPVKEVPQATTQEPIQSLKRGETEQAVATRAVSQGAVTNVQTPAVQSAPQVAGQPTQELTPQAPKAAASQQANVRTQAPVKDTRASSLDDLSDNEVATLIALAQLGSALEEAKDIIPLLHSGGRFKSRSDDHASIVRYLLRTLIAKGLVEDTEAGRELTGLGSALATKALQKWGASGAAAPYRWSPED